MTRHPSPRRSSPETDSTNPAAGPIPSDVLFAVDPDWAVSDDGFSLAREREIESIMTISNGYVGTRGSVPEGTSRSSPATVLAGVFESDASGTSLELVALPDWTQCRILVEGVPLSLERGDILEHRRTLDLQHGLWLRTWRHRDPEGRVTGVRCMRMVALHDRHVFLQSVTITAENYAGTITVASSPGEPPGRTRWQTTREGEAILSTASTSRGASIAMARHGEVRTGNPQTADRAVDRRPEGVCERWTWRAERGEVARVDRVVAVYTSRDTHEPAAEAARHLRRVREARPESLVRGHVRAWENQWRMIGLRVVGDESAQRALRFAAYHLAAVVNPDDDRVSVGARALSGAVYKGHVFWDTEIYLLPFYTFTHPAAARALLRYRYHTLPAARDRARKHGYEGALYAWESADTGEDVTPDQVVGPDGRMIQILTGLQEHHISADVPYAVWQYWRATGDEEFFFSAGADIIIETARFWATRGRVESDGRYHIRTVIGPDEYHEHVSDNAYTNVMAQWNLERAADTAAWLGARHPEVWRAVAERLEVRPEEPAAWRRIAGAMTTGFDPRTNLFEQFDGFYRLEELDLAAYRDRTMPLDILLGRERTQRAKIVKQADVIALSALLWERFPEAVHEANFRYYEPRTAHGSSLSPAIHALVSARLGDTELAARYFRDAAAIDLADGTGNGAGGVHIAALGGLWQAAVFGFAGVRLRDDGVVLDPHLPPAWKEWSFSLQWRGRTVAVSIRREPDQVSVELQGGEPMIIELGVGITRTIDSNHRYVAHRDGAGWGVWQISER